MQQFGGIALKHISELLPDSRSLGQRLEAFADAELHADMDAKRYEEFFGKKKPETDAELAAVSAKIEASYQKIDEWEDGAAQWAGSALRYQEKMQAANKRSTALMNRAKRLKDYMVYWLREAKFERFPGETVAVKVKRASMPKTVMHREAKPEDVKAFPGLVEQIPRSYDWDLKPICAALKALDKKIAAGEALTEAETELQKIGHLEYSYSLQFIPREVAE